ncbi:MAG: hypothetical protein ACLTLQ_20930 [[Clostridium] scindens]
MIQKKLLGISDLLQGDFVQLSPALLLPLPILAKSRQCVASRCSKYLEQDQAMLMRAEIRSRSHIRAYLWRLAALSVPPQGF